MFSAQAGFAGLLKPMQVKNMFRVEAEQGKARAGILKTGHGRVKTPFFSLLV